MFGRFLGAAGTARLMSGKIKAKKQRIWLQWLMFGGLTFIGVVVILVSLHSMSLEGVLMGAVLCAASLYLLSISAAAQKASNYSIFVNTKEDIQSGKDPIVMTYKKRRVLCKMVLGSDDRITFANQKDKLNCFEYEDGSKMSNHAKYCCMNYLAYVLQQNDMLSEDTRVSFEKL